MILERRRELYERLWAGPMFSRWHWLQYNFARPPEGEPERHFARVTLNALIQCEQAMTGYAEDMLERLAACGGREKNVDDYEAILAWLAELTVVRHFVCWDWPWPVTIQHEPTAPGSKLNPEIVVNDGTFRLGVEVKTPKLGEHAARRGSSTHQLLARLPKELVGLSGVAPLLPRDNPVKDYLSSANAKFSGFRASDPNFRSVLVIVWDDYVNEPVSALLSPSSGLLTSSSFDRAADGQRRQYPNLDAVVLLRHQHQLRRGMAGQGPADQRMHFLDYGVPGHFPPNAVIPCPDGLQLEPAQADALCAEPLTPFLGAEYQPAEHVIWT